jgi:hypothetical protein
MENTLHYQPNLDRRAGDFAPIRRRYCTLNARRIVMAVMDKLFEHIDDIEIAMMTTRRPDGHLCSRAMATQKRAAGADLWFVTLDDSGKVTEIAYDPHVNLSYYKDRTREWVGIGHSHTQP